MTARDGGDGTVRRRLIVSGKVQGVFFRDSFRRVASEHGVDGHARNRPDGTVEIVVEGDHQAVERVVAWCHEGPPLASVESVDVVEDDGMPD